MPHIYRGQCRTRRGGRGLEVAFGPEDGRKQGYVDGYYDSKLSGGSGGSVLRDHIHQ